MGIMVICSPSQVAEPRDPRDPCHRLIHGHGGDLTISALPPAGFTPLPCVPGGREAARPSTHRIELLKQLIGV
jgi:hypothetical protein